MGFDNRGAAFPYLGGTPKLLCFVLLVGCGSPDSPSPDGPTRAVLTEAFGSADAFDTRLSRVIDDSNRLTVKRYRRLGSGPETEVEWREPMPAAPLPAAVLPPEMDGPTGASFGRELGRFVKRPKALAVLNDGAGVVVASPEGLSLHAPGKPTRIVNPEPGTWVQLNAAGDQLLVQFGQNVAVLAMPEARESARFEGLGKAGTVSWATQPGRFIALREMIQFDASESDRIYLETNDFDSSSGVQLGNSSLRRYQPFSAVGTLPSAGVMWGHQRSAYRIDAMPAPLLQVEGREAVAGLTTTGGNADVAPCASAAGELVWVRTPRRGSELGRAYFARPAKPEYQLTIEPTWQAAIAPDGGRIAVTTGTDSTGYAVRSASIVDVDADAIRWRTLRDQSRREEDLARGFLEDLRGALARAGRAGAVVDAPLVPRLAEPPSAALVARMASALRTSLKERYNVQLPSGLAGLVQLDAVLARIECWLPEEPAVLLAIAGVVADSSPEPRAWTLAAATAELTPDTGEVSETDGVRFRLVAPFAIARNRLADGVAMAPVMAQFTAAGPRPFLFVESLGLGTQQVATQEQLVALGVDPNTMDLAALEKAVAARKDVVPTLEVALYDAARSAGRKGAALGAAMRLVEAVPTSAEAWRRLADMLRDVWETQAALRCLRQAVLLAPDDAGLRFVLADMLYVAGQPEGAREEYARVLLLDEENLFTPDVASRLALVSEAEKATSP